MIRRFLAPFGGALALLLLLSAFSGPEVAEVCGTALEISGRHEEELEETGLRLELEHVMAFIKVMTFVNREGRLPDCYLDKSRARKRGWRPGRNLWDSVPGAAIGGNRFYNRERRLPARYNGRYIEADLDFAGTRRRGARRLVFVERLTGEWTLWITLDHYETFVRVDPR